MMRTVLAAPRRGLTCLLAMAVSLAVISALPCGHDAIAREDAPKKALPADLTFVPNDALGFVSIRIGDLWNSDEFKDVRTPITKSDPDFPRRLHPHLTVAPGDVERWTLIVVERDVFRGFRRLVAAAIVLTTKPYDAKSVVATIPAAREETIDGKTWHTNGTEAFAALDKTTFVVGDSQAVRAVMDQSGKEAAEALASSLALAAGKHTLTAGFRRANLFEGLLPPEAKPLTDLLDPKAADLTVDLARGFKVEMRLAFSSAPDAEDAATVVRGAAVLARRGCQSVSEFLEKETNNTQNVVKVLKELAPAMKSATIETKDKTVNVSLSVKVEATTMSLALGETVKKVVDATNRMTSGNNLHQMTLAMIDMADSNVGKFPRAAIYSKEGKPLLSWRVAILPFIAQGPLYKEFHLDEPWDSEHNKKLLAKMPRIYLKPGSAPGATTTHYRVLHGPHAAFDASEQLSFPASFTDGTSQTILIVEAEEAVPWTKPDELPFDEKKDLPKLGYKDKDYFMVGMADGSTRLVKKTISKETLKAAITRDGNDILGEDW